MKSVKLTQTWVALGCAAMLFACKKDDAGTTSTPTPDSTYVIGSANYYYADTTEAPYQLDTIYYTDNRISKISTTYTSGGAVLNYDFTYNTAGKITQMSAIGEGDLISGYHQYYNFYYNENNRLDSIREVDSTIWGGNLSFIMDYKDNLLDSVTVNLRDKNLDAPYGTYKFVRNAAGKMDTSFYTYYGNSAVATSYKAATDSAVKLSDAYNLVMAVRNSFQLVGNRGIPKLNLLQLLSPADYMFTGGYYFSEELPFTVGYTKNGLGSLNSYWVNYTTTSFEQKTTGGIQFNYIKVPKN